MLFSWMLQAADSRPALTSATRSANGGAKWSFERETREKRQGDPRFATKVHLPIVFPPSPSPSPALVEGESACSPRNTLSPTSEAWK